MIAGRPAHKRFVDQFGVDPGQYDTTVMLGAALNLLVTFVLYVLVTKAGRSPPSSTARERDKLIGQLGNPRQGEPDGESINR